MNDVSPSQYNLLTRDQYPRERPVIDRRVLWLCSLSIGLGLAATLVARVLVALISFVTNLAFYGRCSILEVSPVDNQLGLFVIIIPIIGALIVGLMARYGSPAIRGHGIPEAMEQVLTNRSRIPPKMAILKPLSAAISIGTGGPFGAEGPIIATGSALGSIVGQILTTTAVERKTLLSAGAAAGMSAIFGTPVSAVLLAIELLLFDFRPRSIIPVALAAVTAGGLRLAILGNAPVFAMTHLMPPGVAAQGCYVLLGAIMGVFAVLITRVVYFVEDAFEHLPVHWMWWPALGAIAVGVVGYIEPRTLGVGYDNISDIISNKLPVAAVATLCTLKFISWSISLGSGTSGGTLAPLFTIGGGLGVVVGSLLSYVFPEAGIDLRIAGLVGMAALFSGASRAMLASAVFAFETTLEPLGLLPLLGGCAAAYLTASLLMKNSIMTEKISRRGIRPPMEYVSDPLDQILVQEIASSPVVSLLASQSVGDVREWMSRGETNATHQGFPIFNDRKVLVGVLTRRDLLAATLPLEKPIGELIRQPIRFVYNDCTVRQVADHMVNHDLGRLPVVDRHSPANLVGIVTRSDVLDAYRRSIQESVADAPTISVGKAFARSQQ